MIALLVDDEPILLKWLSKTVAASPDIERAESFTSETDALAFAEENAFDIAFLDMELHAIDGITVAERLRELRPDCGVVFCTGHANYAVDAISRLRVDGYLLKPIEKDAVQREIDRFKERCGSGKALLFVDVSDGVNVFDKAGRLIHFKRSKTEQLLAVLVQNNGRSLSSRELCELLWEDSKKSPYLLKKNQNYLTQLLTDLRHTLEESGAQDVIKKTADGYAACMPLVGIRKAN